MTRSVSGILLVAMVANTSGCGVWRVQNAPTTEVLAKKPLQTIRIMTVDSIAVVLHQARIVGDSVTGHPTPNAVERRTISLNDVATVATRSANIPKSLFAASAIALGVILYSLLQGLNGTQP